MAFKTAMYALLAGASAATDFPIIGIMAQPKASVLCPNGVQCQYIAASYIKFVESHGARAVPINYNADNATIDALFGSLNGVLFPGGAAKLPPAAQRLWANAIAANAQGDVFPVWGTCLGFEWLVELAGGTLDSGFDSENVSLPLVMTAAAPGSRLLSGLNPSLYAMLQDPATTSAFNNHGHGITPADFANTPALVDRFTVLSTSADLNGVPFVSVMEAADPALPFFGVQWHPEKNVWELSKTASGTPAEAIPHTQDAMAVTVYLAAFFVNFARQSAHAFPTEAAEAAALIWNYPVFGPAQTGSTSFVQEYISDF